MNGFFAEYRRVFRLLRVLTKRDNDGELTDILKGAAEYAARLEEHTDRLCEKLKSLEKTGRENSEGNRRSFKEANTKLTADIQAAVDELQTAKDSIRAVVDTGEKNLQRVNATQGKAEELAEVNAETMQSIHQQLEGIREYTAEQHRLVERYQKGFEWVVVSDLGKRVIRVTDGITKDLGQEQMDNETRARLEDIRDELHFALESKGIELIESVEVGSNSKDLREMVRVRETDTTSAPSKDGIVKDIIRPGYRLVLDAQGPGRVIRPVEVSIWKYTEGEASNE